MAFNQPLAVLYTFTTYGTHLHGDERGSTHKEDGFVAPDTGRVDFHRRQLKFEPVIFTSQQRETIDEAIRAFCAEKKWGLFAINVRTNHLHVVAKSGKSPARSQAQLKAAATKLLRERGLIALDCPVWTEGASTRYLYTQKAVDDACDYVANWQ